MVGEGIASQSIGVPSLLMTEGGMMVSVGNRGVVRVAVTGLDVVGMEEQAPTLVKLTPDEARALAKELTYAAREAEAD